MSRTVAIVLSAWMILAAAPAGAADDDVFELVELRPDTYAALVLPRPAAYAFANSLIVIGDDGVLVVDTQQSPAAARALIAEIRRLTDDPVRWVVNTHWHGDHVYGNAAYRDAFPEVEFIAHETLAADLEGRATPRLRQEIADLPAGIDTLQQQLDDGRGADGEPLDEAARETLRYRLRLRRSYLAELQNLELIAPTRTFTDRLDLCVGGRKVRLLHFGRAHTRGDVVVHLPGVGLVATGDLIERALPYVDDGYPADWAAAIEAVIALEPRIIVPAHGPVERDLKLLRDDAALMRAIADTARTAVEAGKSREETQASPLEPPLMQHFEERYGVSADAFAAMRRQALGRAYDSLAGT